MNRIQLIPHLVSLKTDASGINCFSFWDNKNLADFFLSNQGSKYHFEYAVVDNISEPKEKPKYQFSNLAYFPGIWRYSNTKGPFKFSFEIDETKNRLTVNSLYHKLFIKIGWLQPAGYILTDYITYNLEKMDKFYQDGAAARFHDKTYLFFGFGRNFKTTLVDIIVQKGGYYIGEEFFLLDRDLVYSTIPNSHRFDYRDSHKALFSKDLKKQKIDASTYDRVVFLVCSDHDRFYEIDMERANQLARLYRHECNTHFYNHFFAKDVFDRKINPNQKPILTNKQARFFVSYFSRVDNVINNLVKI